MVDTKTMTIAFIKRGMGYILLYSGKQVSTRIFRGSYQVLCTAEQMEAENLRPGDVIRYEPSGLNFGWFVAKEEAG